MEERLRTLLAEDETLLWSGCPEPFDTMDKTNKGSIMTGLIIKAIVLLGLLALLFRAVTGAGSGSTIGIIALVLLFGAFAFSYPFITVRHMRNKTIYGLTNKRILRAGFHDEGVPYERIHCAAVRTDEDGHSTLLCGRDALKLKPHSWRNAADTSFVNSADDSEASRMVLYALPMDDKLKALLNEHLPMK